MDTHNHELGIIKVPGANDSLRGLFDLAAHSKWWAADTETTGLNQYNPAFRVKIVQMGTTDEAWILNPLFPKHFAAIKKLAETGPPTHWHNWLYDAISLEQLGLDFEAIAARAQCTDIWSRLIDPRPSMKGGVGHKLEQLAPHYLGFSSKKDTQRALWDAWGRKKKVPIKEVFRDVPVDLPEYEIYAGQDVFLTARLASVLKPKIDASPTLRRFAAVELPLSKRIGLMERIGMPFDHAWAEKAEVHFDQLRDAAEEQLLKEWKVQKGGSAWAHTSSTSLRGLFTELGAPLDKRTAPSTRYPEGQVSLDAEVIKELSQLPGKVGALARTVFEAKRNKHYGDYIRTMRAEVGRDGRVHPKVRPMQAATARMSISNPPVQQFPRDDIQIRGCLLADEGEVILAEDYAQIEFRVAAAASQDPVMIGKIKEGTDLHEVTALALFGQGFTQAQRQASKPIGFGRLYLGGADGIRKQMIKSDTTGHVPSLAAIKKAILAFDKQYRVYNRKARAWKDQVDANNGKISTLTGRPLLVSPSYAAANYMVQSTARDVFAAGITRIHQAGLGDRLRLVVHDEVVLTVPPAEAKEIALEVAKCMSTTLMGVPIETEWKIKEERWRK